jgi:glycosyltransferase involved in cell wall biosynthesis
LLGEAFHWEPLLPRAQAQAAMARSNVAVSCSREETFSLAALEAMALGQILLRNRTGGWDEQLLPGVNGFDLGAPGQPVTRGQVDLLAALLDRRHWPDAALGQLAAAARRHAASFADHRYATWLLGSGRVAPC